MMSVILKKAIFHDEHSKKENSEYLHSLCSFATSSPHLTDFSSSLFMIARKAIVESVFVA